MSLDYALSKISIFKPFVVSVVSLWTLELTDNYQLAIMGLADYENLIKMIFQCIIGSLTVAYFMLKIRNEAKKNEKA